MSYNKGPGYTGIGSGTGSSTVSNARAPQRVSGTFSSTMPKKDITSSKYSEINLIKSLADIMESRKPKLIKCCVPIVKEL